MDGFHFDLLRRPTSGKDSIDIRFWLRPFSTTLDSRESPASGIFNCEVGLIQAGVSVRFTEHFSIGQLERLCQFVSNYDEHADSELKFESEDTEVEVVYRHLNPSTLSVVGRIPKSWSHEFFLRSDPQSRHLQPRLSIELRYKFYADEASKLSAQIEYFLDHLNAKVNQD